jgi:dolichol-phosphate mannosyltransferase
VVLPAYNEAENVGAVLETLDDLGKRTGLSLHAIVVDDGSRDATPQIVDRFSGAMRTTLLKHSVNLGLGAAIRTGLLRAVEESSDRDVIVTMDADDTFTPTTIPDMLSKIDSGMDVLIASRYAPGSVVIGVPLHRRFMSLAASILFRVVLPIPGVKDYTCGYRAYRASALREALAFYREDFVNQDGFQCMVDILLKLRKLPVHFGEVPLTLRYDRKGGKSKMKVARTAAKTMLLLGRRRLGL